MLPPETACCPAQPGTGAMDSPPLGLAATDGSLLAIGQDLAPLPEYKAAGTTRLDFGGLLADAPLQLHEDLSSGCGGQLWPAGMVLAKHMLRRHRDKLGRGRILELGAGGGLVSLALARGHNADLSRNGNSAAKSDSGSASKQPLFLVTDQEEMMTLMDHNIRLNGVQDLAKALVLDWGEALPQQVVEFKPEVILAADCVYFEPAFPLLLTTLSDLLTLCPTATVYFCFKKRRRADMQFLKKAKKSFCVAELADEDRPVFSREGLFLLAITARRRPGQDTGAAAGPEEAAERPQEDTSSTADGLAGSQSNF